MLMTLALALLTPPPVDNAAAQAPGAPVRIWMKSTRYEPGDPVRIQVETGQAGYLLVLHYTPESQLEVLFPVEPGDDAYVRSDRRYEIRPPGRSASFIAAGGGMGMIYTALAEEPFRFDEFRLGDQWNGAAFMIPGDTQDPEADLTALVQRMASMRGFDYDVQEYSIDGEIAEGVVPPQWWSPTYVYVENYPGPGCFNCGWYSPAGIAVGVGLGWSWGYSPYYWGWPYGYYGYGHGYFPGYGYPYYPYYPSYRPPYYYPGGRAVNGPRLVGRPRGYDIRPPVRPESRGVGRAVPGGTWGREGGAPAAGPARRARPGSRGEARPNSGTRPDRGVAPAPGGSTGGRPSGGSTGGARPAPPARARPRSGDRPASEARVATGPNIETSRPEARGQSNWVRIEEPPRGRSGDLGRAVRPEAGRTVRIDAPVRSTPQPATRARGSSPGIGLRDALNQARSVQRAAAGGARPAIRPQPSSAPRVVSRPASPSPAPRAAPSGGARSGGNSARPSSGGGNRARPRP